MPEKKPQRMSVELFRRIHRLSSEADWTEAELRAALQESGIDPDALIRRVMRDVNRYLRESPFHWRNKARERRSQLLTKIAAIASQTAKDVSHEDLLKRVQAKLSGLPKPVSTQFALEFRGFQRFSKEDLASMLAELELMEDLEKEEE